MSTLTVLSLVGGTVDRLCARLFPQAKRVEYVSSGTCRMEIGFSDRLDAIQALESLQRAYVVKGETVSLGDCAWVGRR